jgi:Na+/proline symporter
MGYVYAMRDYLPNGLRGLLLASFLAAYMSTISAQFNWGASYLVNDLYVRFINPNSTDKAQINASRLVTFFIALCALFATRFMDSISGVWLFMLEAGGGIGLVLILRWYWWRVNAWSELVATIAPPVVYMLIKYTGLLPAELQIFPNSFFIIVGTTTVLWLLATFATKPESDATLQAFYSKVRPEVGWRPVREALNIPKENTFFSWRIVCWLSAISLGYSILFGMGYLIFKDYSAALISLAVVGVSLYVFLITGKKAKVWNQ